MIEASPFLVGDVPDIAGFQSAYLWLLIVGALAAVLMAYTIGANDVSNAFSTSVGAKSITFRQAVCLACFCETFGAIVLGSDVTASVRKNIIDTDFFLYQPELLMAGMFTSLLAAGTWLGMCSYWGLPVSTTHSIIGALIGVGFITSPHAVNWEKIGWVVFSWISSPCLSGIIAAVIYLSIRWLILRRGEDGWKHALRFYPLLLFILFSALCLLSLFKIPIKALKTYTKDNKGASFGIGFGAAAVLACLMYVCTIQYMRRRIQRVVEASVDNTEDPEKGDKDSDTTRSGDEEQTEPESNSNSGALVEHKRSEISEKKPKKNKLGSWLNVKEKEGGEGELDDEIKLMRDEAESFPPKTEAVFNLLQVISACMNSIAHGANDIANAAAPIGAIIGIYQTASVDLKGPVPIWLLAAAGISLSIGLATYGYKVLQTMGTKMCKITPGRGFSIEMGAMWVVILGSNLGIPLSTTHCMVGATMGVGACETKSIKNIKGVNLKLFGKVLISWVVTLLFTSLISIMLFSIVSTAIFPRSAEYSCGNLFQGLKTMNQKQNRGWDPIYNSSANSAKLSDALKKKWDTKFPGLTSVTETELIAKFPDYSKETTLQAWGDAEKKIMTKAQFVNWRCGGLHLRTFGPACQPLCPSANANGNRVQFVANPVQCRWSSDTKKQDGTAFNQYSAYYTWGACAEPATTTPAV